MKICHNCGEKVKTLTDKCPKCGVIPKTAMPPVFIGIAIAVVLLLSVIAGLILF
ncbi:MAG: hypothetical protein KKE44_20470 [Proteobacteria bacterium]|nr:hypothetical protein [Pseudomonadota bacterium]MBU1585108.1 hypothetical protein [Pseudomonadota bacterium]